MFLYTKHSRLAHILRLLVGWRFTLDRHLQVQQRIKHNGRCHRIERHFLYHL